MKSVAEKTVEQVVNELVGDQFDLMDRNELTSYARKNKTGVLVKPALSTDDIRNMLRAWKQDETAPVTPSIIEAAQAPIAEQLGHTAAGQSAFERYMNGDDEAAEQLKNDKSCPFFDVEFQKVNIELPFEQRIGKTWTEYPIANPVTEDSIRNLEGQLRHVGYLHAQRNAYLEIIVGSAINPSLVTPATLATILTEYNDVTYKINYYLDIEDDYRFPNCEEPEAPLEFIIKSNYISMARKLKPVI